MSQEYNLGQLTFDQQHQISEAIRKQLPDVVIETFGSDGRIVLSRALTGPELTAAQAQVAAIKAGQTTQQKEDAAMDAIITQWNAIAPAGLTANSTVTEVYTALSAEANTITTQALMLASWKKWMPFYGTVLFWIFIRIVKAIRP